VPSLDDDERTVAVLFARSSPPRWVTIGYGVGVRVPAHVVTPGFVVLSAYDDDALDAWIKAHEFVSYTRHHRQPRHLPLASQTSAGTRLLAHRATTRRLPARRSRGADRPRRCKGAVGGGKSRTLALALAKPASSSSAIGTICASRQSRPAA
jgi:hypothetical protein